MKKLFFTLLSVAIIDAFGQGKTLYTINIVKPKAGMKAAFEASWKLHLDKFHKTDDKRMVYEVTSGPEAGSYIIIEGPFAYADMDKDKPNAKEHSLDVDKNLSVKLEPGGMNFTLRWADTLSYNSNAIANSDKVLITRTHVKDGKMAGYLAEVRRSALISEKLKSPLSYSINIKQLAGTNPMIVTVRNLKDGFKEMEQNYFQLPPNTFREAYIKDYGQEEWDKRVKMLVDDVVSRELHFEKKRVDLSSK